MLPITESNLFPFFYNQSPSFTTIPESNNISFHHHQESFNYLLPLINPSISENPIDTLLLEAPFSIGNSINNSSSNMVNHMSNKRAVGKRDRHTKICTAQGIRDRRVRLSITIAREFFSLQDMLGFDKASKTLGWLLEKSKAAIDELISTLNENNGRVTCPALAQNIGEGNNDNNEDEPTREDLEEKLSSKKRGRSRENSSDGVVANEIRRRRAKARERARERTKSKKTVISYNNNHQLKASNQQDEQQMAGQNLLISQSSSAALPISTSTCGFKGVTLGDSVMIRSKLRGSSYNYSYDIASKDDQEGYNYYDDYLTKSESDCYHGIIQPPGFSALNIVNLSTEIHINATPWDTYDNQLQQ